MTLIFILVGFVLAISILSFIPKVKETSLRAGLVLLAAIVFSAMFTASSFRHVGENELGVIVKNVGTRSLPPGQILAVKGEKGPQAKILAPGWHPWLWPVIYEVDIRPLIEIKEGFVGLLTTSDGKPLPKDAIYAPEWDKDVFQKMLQADYFLSQGNGYKGPQASVLTPGKYRINPKLFNVEMAQVTNIEKATVGIVKSNVGQTPDINITGGTALVDRGYKGIWSTPLLPQEYYLNTQAYEVTPISTAKRVIRYTRLESQNTQTSAEEREITVRSMDGFTFPVDVRVEYEIEPSKAALVVANFGDDGDVLGERLNSAVRAIFRNNAERVRAMDYVQQRSEQETKSQEMLSVAMEKVGVTVTAVRIGDVGNEETLGELLKTQTDREIAAEEVKTFKQQQLAMEQQKELSKTQQEAEEEKRLATASYEVKIAEQDKLKKVIAAEAEAEAITIRAKAQADAFKVIAQQIGPGNAALIELLKIIGTEGIQITPRVMVSNAQAGDSPSDAQTTALIGTMLDSMISKEPIETKPE